MTDQQPIVEPGETFDTGTVVPAAGTYVCAPCGYKKHLHEGQQFPECDSCMGGPVGAEDDEEGTTPSGIWEYAGEDVESDEEDDTSEEEEE